MQTAKASRKQSSLSGKESAQAAFPSSCRDQEGRRGSEEAVPGPSVFPSGPRHNSRIPPQLEKNHVGPTAWQDA